MDKVKVYVITDREAIDFLVNDDIDGFKEYLLEEPIDFNEPVLFDSEAEALAFCAGLGYGVDETSVVETYPLRSCEPCDMPYIQAIENYET